jgi:hypothetical protein
MPQFIVQIIEDVTATITLTVAAKSAKEAAKKARHAWVTNGQGELSEAVNEREVYINGTHFETTDEDE